MKAGNVRLGGIRSWTLAGDLSQMSRKSARIHPRPARLIIVDDHELARAGVRKLLVDAPGLELVGEAASGREALLLCRRLRPDLVLMDVRLQDMDGLSATRALRRAAPSSRVLLFTMYEAVDYLREAVRAGAAGYVLKGASRRELLMAVHKALDAPATAPGNDDETDA
jgi:DNA-binding NarL/FixJ family response regulator